MNPTNHLEPLLLLTILGAIAIAFAITYVVTPRNKLDYYE